MAVDLYTIIFEELLRISPTLLTDPKYFALQDKLIYLILIPHVILFLFIWTFGYWLVGSRHRGIRYLITLIAYIYFVWAGWYGTWVTPLILGWFPLILISFFLFFILTKIFPPLNVLGASRAMSGVIEKATHKRREIKKLDDQVDLINKKIRRLEQGMRSARDERARSIMRLEIEDLKQKKVELKHRIDKLGG